MKKKKEIFWTKNRLCAYGCWIVIIFLLSLFIILGNYFQSDTQWCKKNPDKCVCEEWMIDNGELINGIDTDKEYLKRFIEMNPHYDWELTCHKYHKLTPTEKAIKDCNENPREDEDCKCVEEKLYMVCITDVSQSVEINKMNQITRSRTQIFPSECYNETKCISSIPRLKPIEINLEEEKCVEWKKYCKNFGFYPQFMEQFNKTLCVKANTWGEPVLKSCTKKEKLNECEKRNDDYIFDEGIQEVICDPSTGVMVNCESIVNINNGKIEGRLKPTIVAKIICREKTPCEKGNKDWVEEEKEIVNPEYFSNCCEDVDIKTETKILIHSLNLEENEEIIVSLNVSTANKDSFILHQMNKICYDASDSVFSKIGSVNMTKCFLTPRKIMETTCRPKTEVEKLMDKDCDWLFQYLCRSSKHNQNHCQNLKTAWRNLECEV